MSSLLAADWLVRPLATMDLPLVLVIEQASYHLPWSVDLFATLLQAPDALALGCLQPTPEGALLAGYLCGQWLPDAVEIHNVASRPDLRRCGVARRLFAVLEAQMRQRGCDQMLLEVRRGNLAALNLYLQLGFVEQGCRRGYYRDGEDALLLGRVLAPV